MKMICKDCNSDDIGFDALVDKDGGIIRMYEGCECMSCGSSRIIEERDCYAVS
jgi:hypothetical protein